MKVVKLLKPCGAQSFLEHGAASVPHLGNKTRCFLDMFITHTFLKMCKCLAWSVSNQENISHFWKIIAHCRHLKALTINSWFLLPKVMNATDAVALPTWLNPVWFHARFLQQTIHLDKYPPKVLKFSYWGQKWLQTISIPHSSVITDSLSLTLHYIFHHPLDPVDAPRSCPKTPRIHQRAHKQVKAETTPVISVLFKVHLSSTDIPLFLVRS